MNERMCVTGTNVITENLIWVMPISESSHGSTDVLFIVHPMKY